MFVGAFSTWEAQLWEGTIDSGRQATATTAHGEPGRSAAKRSPKF
jgi:hypothetical protein